MESFDAVVDDALVPPAHQPERSRAVEEVVVARTFPDEVPGIFRIHSNRTPAMSVHRVERSRVGFREIALPVVNRVRVIAGRGWHKPDPKDTAVTRITEAVDSDLRALSALPERSAQGRIQKWISGIRPRHMRRNFDEIVSLHR